MECIIGLRCKNFAIVAADCRVGMSILTFKHDEDKIYELSKSCLMGICGEPGDTTNFAEYIQQNMQLYEIRNGYQLTPNAAANFTRKNMANALRSRNPYHVNMVLAGFDAKAGPSVHYIDYLACHVEVPYAIHGYGGHFALTVLDKGYKEDMTIEQATDLLKEAICEIHKRLVINMDRFSFKYVDIDGIHKLPDFIIPIPA